MFSDRLGPENHHSSSSSSSSPDNMSPYYDTSYGGYSGSRAGRSKMRNSSRTSQLPIPIPLKPLQDGRNMDPKERMFLEAAEKGDKHQMIRCLNEPICVSVNCTNILGRSAIQIAVDNENHEIVELLLNQNGVKIGDALLYAIREGVYRIVEMLIDHPSITREMLGCDWSRHKSSGEESSDYSPDVSPIILAAHCNQFEILQLLLSRGARIEKPHHLICSCFKCRKEVKADSLRHSLLRIYTYRALASPAWISLTSPDPVLTAFKLSWELERLAMQENEFKDIYAGLSDQCKKYACDLLDQCRSTEEVIAVLNKGCDSDESDDDNEEVNCEHLTLSRLKLALKYDQKQFTAHPHCQQLLTSIWYEGLPGWRKRNILVKILMIIGLLCLLPVMAVYYLILPRSRIGKLVRSPFMKFMYHSASFGVFLFLLILASGDINTDFEDKSKRRQQRGPPPSILEWIIVMYVFGFIWGECKQLWEEGLKAYIRQWWNWLDFIMLSLYLCTFSLRTVAYFQSYDEESYGQSRMPRTMWPDTDPTLISEGVFAIANVFSFARIIYLFQDNPQLGPLQISLGCMLVDIGKFLFIFFLVLTSFACGLNQLYYYYSDDDVIITPAQPVCDGPNLTTPTSPLIEEAKDYKNAFNPLVMSYVTLFWSLFGLTQLSTVRDGHMHNYTKSVGEALLMGYHAMAIVVLTNMLIAMMSSSFQDIEAHADREWKFARSKLWMGYFDEGSTLPTPFNLIISPKSIYYSYAHIKRWLLYYCCGRRSGGGATSTTNNATSHRRRSADGTIKLLPFGRQPNKTVSNTGIDDVTNSISSTSAMRTSALNNNASSCETLSAEVLRTKYNGDSKGIGLTEPPEKPKYQDVMRRLVSRFIHQMKKEMRQDGVNADDLLEIKQDISSLRCELREDRKKEAKWTAGHIDNLKRDIMRSLRGAGLNSPSNHESFQSQPHKTMDSISPTIHHQSPDSLLSPADMDHLKREIVTSLRSELRDLAREMVTGVAPPLPPRDQPNVSGSIFLPPPNSELYHTHLYTQL